MSDLFENYIFSFPSDGIEEEEYNEYDEYSDYDDENWSEQGEKKKYMEFEERDDINQEMEIFNRNIEPKHSQFIEKYLENPLLVNEIKIINHLFDLESGKMTYFVQYAEESGRDPEWRSHEDLVTEFSTEIKKYWDVVHTSQFNPNKWLDYKGIYGFANYESERGNRLLGAFGITDEHILGLARIKEQIPTSKIPPFLEFFQLLL